jgi:CysZ protein
MKAIQLHIDSIKATFETFSKGKLLLFFIPGIIIGCWYLWSSSLAGGIHETADSSKDVWLIGSLLGGFLHLVADFADWLLLIIFQFIILTLLSPFNSVLSEKFDTELTGRKFESGFVRIMNDLLRMILVVFIALFLELFFMLFWWFLSFIPPLGLLTPVVYFIVSSFFFGFAFYDYSLERHNIGTLRSLGFAFSKFWYMVLTGGIFSLVFKIPFVGIILAPILATMISTGVYVKMHEKPATPEIL